MGRKALAKYVKMSSEHKRKSPHFSLFQAGSRPPRTHSRYSSQPAPGHSPGSTLVSPWSVFLLPLTSWLSSTGSCALQATVGGVPSSRTSNNVHLPLAPWCAHFQSCPFWDTCLNFECWSGTVSQHSSLNLLSHLRESTVFFFDDFPFRLYE